MNNIIKYLKVLVIPIGGFILIPLVISLFNIFGMEINKIVLGEDFLERTTKKRVKVLNAFKKATKIVGLVTLSVAGAYKAFEETKDIMEEATKSFKK